MKTWYGSSWGHLVSDKLVSQCAIGFAVRSNQDKEIAVMVWLCLFPIAIDSAVRPHKLRLFLLVLSLFLGFAWQSVVLRLPPAISQLPPAASEPIYNPFTYKASAYILQLFAWDYLSVNC